MKKRFVKELREGEKVREVFLVAKKDLASTQQGKPYLNLKLRDRTGEIEARVWDNAEELSGRFSRDDFIRVTGTTVSYRDKLQVNVTGIKRLDDGELPASALGDFLPASVRDPEQMIEELDAIIRSIGNKDLRALLQAVFADEAVRERFMTAPAAKVMHHAYFGGLLEHVLSICGLARAVCSNYDDVNSDLVITGCILHDIGKIQELSYLRSFDYTDEGKLIGHISIGIELVDEKLKRLKDFPRDLKLHLKHIMLSHHGYYEFGSPKRPKTLEGVIVYYLDDLDSKVAAIRSLRQAGKDDERWVYSRALERQIYIGESPGSDEQGEQGEGEPAMVEGNDEEGSVKGEPGRGDDDEDLDLFKKR